MSPLPADTARWWNDQDWKHFLDHGREVGARTVVEYDRSARRTIRLGKRFTYVDPDYGVQRVGYFTPSNGRFTALNSRETRILTHFVPDSAEQYVRDLPESTYQR